MDKTKPTLPSRKEDTVTTNKYQGVTDQRQSQRKSNKATSQGTKKEHSGKDEGNIIIWEAEEAK